MRCHYHFAVLGLVLFIGGCHSTPISPVPVEQAKQMTVSLVRIQQMHAEAWESVAQIHRDYSAMSDADKKFFSPHYDELRKEYTRAQGGVNAYIDYLVTNIRAKGLDNGTLEDLSRQNILRASEFMDGFDRMCVAQAGGTNQNLVDPVEAEKMLQDSIHALAQEAISYWQAVQKANENEKEKLTQDLQKYRWEDFDKIPALSGSGAKWPHKNPTIKLFTPRVGTSLRN